MKPKLVIGNVPPGIVPVPLAPVINTFVKAYIFDTIHLQKRYVNIKIYTTIGITCTSNIAYKISNR
jgi:hypothetical protein